MQPALDCSRKSLWPGNFRPESDLHYFCCFLTLLPHAAPSHSKQHRAVHATALVRRQQQQAQPRGRSALHTSFAFGRCPAPPLRSHVPSPLCPLTSCGCVALTADGRVPLSPCSLAHTLRPLPHCAPVTCACDSALRCSLRRRGSSTMHAALAVIQSSTLAASLLHSAHAVPSHSSTHTGSPSPMLLAWIPLRSLLLPSRPLPGQRPSAPLSAYTCTVFTVYDERQPECAARYAFTGVSVSLQPYVRQPLVSSLSHQIRVIRSE